jgi:hypothetical protein
MEIQTRVILDECECRDIEKHLLSIAKSDEWLNLYGRDAAKALIEVCAGYCGPDKLEAAKDAAAAIYEWVQTTVPFADLKEIGFLAWFLDDAYQQAADSFEVIANWMDNNPNYTKVS